VLRFWESRFHEIRPMKRGGGRRYYRPEDLDLLRGIRHLLYGEGYTIRGVQRLLREQGVHFVQNVWQPGAPQPSRQAGEEGEEAERRVSETQGAPLPSLNDVGDESAQEHSAAAGGLAPEDLQKLRAALRELTECRRVLDAALGGKA
jgi:DNA-binding transcriptional MerR regulator